MHTRLGLETIKVSGIDLKRREVDIGGGGGEKERESAREGSAWATKVGLLRAGGGLLRAVRSINGGRFGPCRTTGHGGS